MHNNKRSSKDKMLEIVYKRRNTNGRSDIDLKINLYRPIISDFFNVLPNILLVIFTIFDKVNIHYKLICFCKFNINFFKIWNQNLIKLKI